MKIGNLEPKKNEEKDETDKKFHYVTCSDYTNDANNNMRYVRGWHNE